MHIAISGCMKCSWSSSKICRCIIYVWQVSARWGFHACLIWFCWYIYFCTVYIYVVLLVCSIWMIFNKRVFRLQLAKEQQVCSVGEKGPKWMSGTDWNDWDWDEVVGLDVPFKLNLHWVISSSQMEHFSFKRELCFRCIALVPEPVKHTQRSSRGRLCCGNPIWQQHQKEYKWEDRQAPGTGGRAGTHARGECNSLQRWYEH